MTDTKPAPSSVTASVEGNEGARRDPETSERDHARDRWPYWVAAAVFAVGIVVTGVLVWISASTYARTENRLLELRVRDAGALISERLPSIQTPLASAAALADATHGDVHKFESFIAPSVPPRGRQFASVSLWRLGAGQPKLMAMVGSTLVLGASPARVASFFDEAAHNAQLNVIGLLHSSQPRLGYAFTSPGLTGHFVAYAETALPADRRSRLQGTSSFADLDYALYLGRSQETANLLVTDVKKLPITARHAAISIPFGTAAFTFVVTPRHPLSGTFGQRLPWAIAIVGLLLSIGAAALAARLILRRNQAQRLAVSLEQIAEENRRLYSEQRSIARTLQHALLPEALPTIRGVETGARYEAGVEGVEIGGDWYDLIALDEHRLLLVVGDVSGRGVRAAATMAALRFAIHAYAADDDQPDEILTKLSNLVNISGGHLATILCAVLDTRSHRLTVTSAGHLPPLLISNGDTTFVRSEVGVPIGVRTGAEYTSTSIQAPPAATLLAFTDGLVERRGESIDAGLGRLERAAVHNTGALDELLGELIENLRGDGSDDDTAIAALRWQD